MADMTLRGKCKEMSEAACAADPTLTLQRGYYYCSVWGQQAHWWTTRPDGSIFDPTAAQFPSGGRGVYEVFDGRIPCAECGKEMTEQDAQFAGSYAVCSDRCYMSLVGVEGVCLG